MKFKIFKTEIYISFLFLCLASICIILGVFKGFLYCFLSVIIHETGHLIPMYLYGNCPEKIKISLFEISISDKSRLRLTEKQNLVIIFSGPFANFICFILFYLLYLFCYENLMPFAVTNLSVGLFNMLPVISLDGGQILYLLLCRRFTEKSSEKAVDIITFIFIFPLAALGFLFLFSSKYNFSLLFVCVYLIFSLVCKNNRFY